MKKLLSITKVGLVGAFLAIGFSGCGSSLASSLTGSSSSTDSLKITKSGNDFSVIWDKKSEGYSKVVYMSEAIGSENIMTDNSSGKHTLNCTLYNSSSSRASYSCTGSGPSILGGQMELQNNFYFIKGVEYKILINYGTMNIEEGDINYIIEFNGDTLSIH